jgi:(p)ppGpp synthase/HD superfamily hydrolase
MSAEACSLMWNIATKFHAGQKYGDGPYTDHLGAVEASVQQGCTDERARVVAIGHDLLEDTLCTEGLLRLLFEDNVVDAIVALTKLAEESRDEYLVRVKKNQLARIVKLHDSFCNLRESLERYDAKRIKKYSAQINFLVSE